MKEAIVLLCCLAALGLAGCNQSGDRADVPAQAFANALTAIGVDTGRLTGQILYPSEFTQHSTRFSIDGLTFVTHPDGRFLVKRIPAGAHTLRVRIKGYDPVERPIRIAGGEETALPQLRLKQARGLVLGRMVKEGGASAPGIHVHLEPDSGVTVTDQEGIFQFLGVSSGEHTLMVKDPRYFVGNKRFHLSNNEKRNLGIIQVYRQIRADGRTASRER